MAISPRTMRIGGATLVAVFLVAGAYILPSISVPQTKEVNAELTDDILASYVSKDTDQDGLPDWQEALYGTDLNNPDTDGDGVTDGEAVRQGLLTPTALASQLPSDAPITADDFPGEAAAPGSITDDFARTFFNAYIQQSNGQQMSAEAQDALLRQLLADFTARASRSISSQYTQLSVRTGAEVSVMSYAAAFEEIFRSNDVAANGETTLTLTQKIIENDDANARRKLDELSKAYGVVAAELLLVRVPPSLSDEHLQIIRSLDTLARATELVVNHEKDPLGVLASLSVFKPEGDLFLSGVQGIAMSIIAAGEPLPGDTGSMIVELARTRENI